MSKRVLITGADGFIGSHLTELLLANGYKVKALAQYNSLNHWGWLENIKSNKNLEVITGDIRDPHFCKLIIKGVDVIFHLAALIAIPYSYIAPDLYFDTNVKGTLNICQAARDAGNIRIIVTSTSEVYGTAQYVPIDENHPKQAQSPYSASKIGADAMAISFYNSFNLPVTIARPFNTYGPRQSARAIIPTIIAQIASGRKQLKVGDLTPTRDFNFVLDICQGFISILKSDKTIGREINISSCSEISMQDLLNLIISITGSDVEVVSEDERKRPQKSEVTRLFGNNNLLKELTGWRSRYTLEEGLRLTFEWFLKPDNLSNYKSDIYNL